MSSRPFLIPDDDPAFQPTPVSAPRPRPEKPPAVVKTSGVTTAFLGDVVEGIGDHVRKTIENATAPLLARIDALEKRGFKGAYQRAQTYERGDMVLHSGALWTCLDAGADEPGHTKSWQLIVKSPR